MNFGETFASLFVLIFALCGVAASFALFGEPRAQPLARNVVLTAAERRPAVTAGCGQDCLPTAAAAVPSAAPSLIR